MQKRRKYKCTPDPRVSIERVVASTSAPFGFADGFAAKNEGLAEGFA